MAGAGRGNRSILLGEDFDKTYEIENVYCCNLYVVRGLGLSGGYLCTLCGCRDTLTQI